MHDLRRNDYDVTNSVQVSSTAAVTAAVRELFRLGLTNAGLTLAKNGKKSSDFGVLEDGIKGRRKRETPASNIISQIRR